MINKYLGKLLCMYYNLYFNLLKEQIGYHLL